MPDIHITPGHWWWDKDMAVPTVGALLAEGVQRLQGLEAPRFEAEVLLAELLRCDRAGLWAHPARSVPAACAERYGVWIEERARGMPSAYLTGRREFWSLALHVTRETLVPRPETELLVSLALDRVRATEARELLDLGTGSGAIALAIASERPHARVTATDVSTDALTVALQNAERLELGNVAFEIGDWYGPVGAMHFDLIVSNPPYVASQDAALRGDGVLAEPRLALTPGPRGLEAIERIAAGARDHLRSGGWLAIEHGLVQAETVAALFSAHGLSTIRSLRDLAGHHRVTAGRLE